MKTKSEAAAYLGVSVRTLERYTRAGRIPSRFEPGPRHARVVYQEEHLAELQADLAAERARRPADVRSPSAMRRIGFRLEPVDLALLEEQARRQQVSPGDLARHLVISVLHDSRATELTAAVAGIERRIAELQQDLARRDQELHTAGAALVQATRATDRLRSAVGDALYLLLCQLTDADPQEVQAAVNQTLGRRQE